MLPSALWKLIRLQRRAAFKRVVRGIKTPRGAIFFGIGVMMILLWFAPTLRALIRGEQTDPVPIRTFLPPALLLLCAVNVLSSAGEQAVAFMPAEVDLLFAAPFTRRQLLGYKIVQSALSAMTVATLFSVIWLKYGGPWIAAWIGYAMTMLFSRLVGMAGTLVGQAVGERAYTRGRRVILFVLIALVAAAGWPLVREGFSGPPREWVAQFAQGHVGAAILAPFRVFAMLVTADRLYPDALQYFSIAAGIIAALVVIVMWLDVHYLESAAAAGAQVYAKIQQARRGAALISPAKPRAVRWRPPRFPRLGGAGPIARRQLTAALRQSRGVFVLMMIVCAVGVVLLVAMKGETDLTGPIAGGIVWVTLMLTNNLRFDFRGDADHIDALKALPVRPAAVVVAQLAAPVVMLWLCQVILVAAAVALGRVPAIMLPLDGRDGPVRGRSTRDRGDRADPDPRARVRAVRPERRRADVRCVRLAQRRVGREARGPSAPQISCPEAIGWGRRFMSSRTRGRRVVRVLASDSDPCTCPRTSSRAGASRACSTSRRASGSAA
jgi:hypothetical protein